MKGFVSDTKLQSLRFQHFDHFCFVKMIGHYFVLTIGQSSCAGLLCKKERYDQYSTASEATGCHIQFSALILTIALLSVAPPRFVRGTVLVSLGSVRFDCLCKAALGQPSHSLEMPVDQE